MDVERTIEFILQQHARTEAMMQRLEEKSREDIATLTASQTRLAENLITLTDLVRQINEQNQEEHQRFSDRFRQISEQNQADHRRFEEFHREVDERFNALIQMMDEWIRGQRKQNGRP